MPIGEQSPLASHTGNGVATTFAYSFGVLAADDLKVLVNGVEVTSGFTVTGIGSRTGGTVVFASAPANGAAILIMRQIVLKRDTDYQYSGDLREEVLDNDFDRIWMALQDQLIVASRTIRGPIGDVFDELPAAASRSLRVLGFDSAGKPVLLTRTDDGGSALALALAADDGASLVGFKADPDHGVSTTLLAHGRLMVSLSSFGFVSGTGIDNAIAVGRLNAFFLKQWNLRKGVTLICEGGDYETSVPLRIIGQGIKVVPQGRVRFIGTAADRTVWLGDAPAKSNATTQYITSNLLKGGTSCTVSSTAGMQVGDYLFMMAYESINSNRGATPSNQLPANWIPQHKQLFTIASINSGTNTVTFKERAEYDFPGFGATDPRTGASTLWYNAGRFHDPSMASYQPLLDSEIGAVHFVNNVGTSATYMATSNAMSNTEFRGTRFSAASACGYVGNGDKIRFYDCKFSGFGGFSTANGTKHVTFEGCEFNAGDGATQQVALFIEESSEKVEISHCNLLNGQLNIGAAADSTVAKQYIVRDTEIIMAGSPTKPAVVIGGIQQPTDGSGGILFDNVKINTSGANSNRGNKCAVDIFSSKWVEFRGVKIYGLDSDAFGIDFNDADCQYLRFDRHCRRSGGLALVGPGNPLANALVFVSMDNLETALPVDSVSGVRNGRRYITFNDIDADQDEDLHVRWVFDAMPVNTYQLFRMNRTNGEHIVDLEIFRSGSGRSIAFKTSAYRSLGAAITQSDAFSHFQNASHAFSNTNTTDIVSTLTNSQATSNEVTIITARLKAPRVSPIGSVTVY